MTLTLVIGAFIGFVLGAMGGGGSMLALPALVYLGGVSVEEAIGISLVVVGATSLIGGLLSWRKGNVHPKAALVFSSVGVIGALAGAQVTPLVPSDFLLFSFAFLMLVVAILMLRRKHQPEPDPDAPCRVKRCLLVGFGVGALTGFLGVGGGFVIVPALVFLVNMPMRTATGTSLIVIAASSFSGVVGHLPHLEMDWAMAGSFLLASVIGMLLGLASSVSLPVGLLQKGFAWIVLVVAMVVVANGCGYLQI